ncbi:winged helix-turn-helix transcriptional regulator [Shimazuella kribbensis]|uniref:winged helix-turn-helix transcriptional regulator n=1 Tax=Shimazuella kribbensis TaxID=139808 RepID=UPI000410E9C1|nr:helix-turn-helix domain-containing protein [Shimazuella kribbensis]
MDDTSQNDEKYEECTSLIGEVLGILGVKRTFLVIGKLHDGPKRFNQLRRGLGEISTQSLTVVLRHLESNGIINREVLPTSPVTVEYSLTEQGKQFNQVLDEMYKWGQTWKQRRLL